MRLYVPNLDAGCSLHYLRRTFVSKNALLYCFLSISQISDTLLPCTAISKYKTHCKKSTSARKLRRKKMILLTHSNLEYVLVKIFCPNKSDNKFMNYRQQTTIFHWNQNETKSHFGGPVVHRQKCSPNMGRMGCVS